MVVVCVTAASKTLARNAKVNIIPGFDLIKDEEEAVKAGNPPTHSHSPPPATLAAAVMCRN